MYECLLERDVGDKIAVNPPAGPDLLADYDRLTPSVVKLPLVLISLSIWRSDGQLWYPGASRSSSGCGHPCTWSRCPADVGRLFFQSSLLRSLLPSEGRCDWIKRDTNDAVRKRVRPVAHRRFKSRLRCAAVDASARVRNVPHQRMEAWPARKESGAEEPGP